MQKNSINSIETIENLIFLGNLSQADEILRPFLANHPDEPQWYRLKLMILYEKYRRQEVEKMVLTISHKFPQTPESALALALMPGITVLQTTRRINKAIKMNPSDPYLFYLRGRNAIHQNSYVYALADLNISLDMNENITKAYLLRADCLSRLGMHKHAFRDLITLWNLEQFQNEETLMVRILCELMLCFTSEGHSLGTIVISTDDDIEDILRKGKFLKFIHNDSPAEFIRRGV